MNKLMDESYRLSFIRTFKDGISNTNLDVLDGNMLNYIREQEKKIIKTEGRQAIEYTEYGVDGSFMPGD
ncbi:hypothetical protein [Ruminococcus sp. zg-924]|nr:hypothetical protein [Ruminococcus sp. zg-924]MCQ4021722.1 hypothetical protein [Ruminococcus sp. zg-924]MCQ4114167.1 hypothetical protein [Ruminococcus sp. zg-921]